MGDLIVLDEINDPGSHDYCSSSSVHFKFAPVDAGQMDAPSPDAQAAIEQNRNVSAFNLSRTPPRQLEIGYQGTYSRFWRLVLVLRASPRAMPVCSPSLFWRRLQKRAGISVSMAKSNCLAPAP